MNSDSGIGSTSNSGAEGEGFAGAEGEGFAGAEGEGFAGVIAKVKSIFVPSLSNIRAGSLLQLVGTDFQEGIQIKVSGVACTNVQISDALNLLCTLEQSIESVTVVTAQNPETSEQEFTPTVISTDKDNDWVPDTILNAEVVCPLGTCTGPDCLVPTEVVWDGEYEYYIFDPCRLDNCPTIVNPLQSDDDNDGIGNLCDADYTGDDNDSYELIDIVNGYIDNPDADGDGIDDVSDPYPNGEDTIDNDGDGVADMFDNCLWEPNENQADANHDGVGDRCDYSADTDNDGVSDAEDNCPLIENPDQEDEDGNFVGDACTS